MDELTLIRDFSLSERSASAAERDRARAGLLAHASRASRSRVARRHWVIALAAAVLLLVTGTAFAFGPLRGIFEGEPAPPQVKRAIADYIVFREELDRIGLGEFVVRSEDATGLIRFRVGKLTVRVWTAPLVDGGSCTFVDTVPFGGLSMGPCTAPQTVQPPLLYGMGGARDFGLLAGHVTDDVARVDARLGSGRTRHLRLVNGFFATGFADEKSFLALENRENRALLAQQEREAKRGKLSEQQLYAHEAAWKALGRRQAARRTAGRPTALTAYDAAGRSVESVTLPAATPDAITTFPFAEFYKGMRALLQVNTPMGFPAILVLREHGHDARSCESVWWVGSGGPVDCREHWMRNSTAPGRLLLAGDAGEDAAAAEIRYGTGQREVLQLLEGRFLVDLTVQQLAAKPELVVRDASGKIIRTRVLARPSGP